MLKDGWEVTFTQECPHVHPHGENHVLNNDCWCYPIEDDGIIVHNSADGREFFENGIRKPN